MCIRDLTYVEQNVALKIKVAGNVYIVFTTIPLSVKQMYVFPEL